MAVVLLAVAAGCSGGDEAEGAGTDQSAAGEAPVYPPFTDVDPYLSLFFVTLEDSGLAAELGEEQLYNFGLMACGHLDAGRTVEDVVAEDSKIGDDWGSVVGAAVTDLCPQHGDAVEAYLAANG